ncbi:hypothetical protein BDF19DRAFT_451049 [Syncephalis fuscata]|nr:hypothetical protein BDF19DRAFT_451049 [Syncephalis fuscata]
MQLTQTSTLAVAAFLLLANSAANVMAQDASGGKFADNLPAAKSESCKLEVNKVSYVASELQSCYRNNGVYFSTPDVVCSPNCMNASIEGSKKLTSACNLTKENTKDSPSHVYVAWSNEAAAKAACTKNTAGKFCIETFSSMGATAANLALSKQEPHMVEKYKLNELDWRAELDCDGPCTRALYDAVNGDGNQAPVLYYFGFNSFKDIFAALEEKCGFKPKTADATKTAVYDATATADATEKKTTPCTKKTNIPASY